MKVMKKGAAIWVRTISNECEGGRMGGFVSLANRFSVLVNGTRPEGFRVIRPSAMES